MLFKKINRDLQKEAIEVSYKEKGNIRTKRAYIIDFDKPENNEFLVANQFTIIENQEKRPDLILFVNGILLVVVELKSATDENVGIIRLILVLK